MTIQFTKDVELPTGAKIRAGSVLNVPDVIANALVKRGVARPHETPGPTERKITSPVLVPGDPLPPAVPYVRVATDPQPARSYEPGAYEDQDNFVSNLVTLVSPLDWWDGGGASSTPPAPPVTPSGSASGRTPILALDLIKLHCHIEPDQTEEDELLTTYEMAARLHAENYLRYQIDQPLGENIQLALLMLIAHWYRNREAVSTGRTTQGVMMPLAVTDLLAMERDYPSYT